MRLTPFLAVERLIYEARYFSRESVVQISANPAFCHAHSIQPNTRAALPHQDNIKRYATAVLGLAKTTLGWVRGAGVERVTRVM